MAHFDPEQPGRTVHNGSTYDERKVYEVTASALLDEVQSVYGTGEVEKTGRKINEVRVYHLIAKNEALARALFAQHYSAERYLVRTVRALFTIDGEISTGHK